MARRTFELSPGRRVLLLGLLALITGVLVGRMNRSEFTEQQQAFFLSAGVVGLVGLRMLTAALKAQRLASRRTARTTGTIAGRELEATYDDGKKLHRWQFRVNFRAGKANAWAEYHPTGSFTDIEWFLDRAERKFPDGTELVVYYDPRELANARVGRAWSTYAALVLLLPVVPAGLFASAYFLAADLSSRTYDDLPCSCISSTPTGQKGVQFAVAVLGDGKMSHAPFETYYRLHVGDAPALVLPPGDGRAPQRQIAVNRVEVAVACTPNAAIVVQGQWATAWSLTEPTVVWTPHLDRALALEPASLPDKGYMLSCRELRLQNDVLNVPVRDSGAIPFRASDGTLAYTSASSGRSGR